MYNNNKNQILKYQNIRIKFVNTRAKNLKTPI